MSCLFFFFFQAEDGIRDVAVTGVQTCALPISPTYSTCSSPDMRLTWCSAATATEGNGDSGLFVLFGCRTAAGGSPRATTCETAVACTSIAALDGPSCRSEGVVRRKSC